MKVAILVGVSDYLKTAPLPACKNDVDLLKALLDKTGEYQEVLSLGATKPSAYVKQQITSFAAQFKGKSVDQVLFYFTGHGDFDGQELSLLLSDYEPARRKQTVIENTELDDWLRVFDAAVAVKIIDACHSGVQYIKDPDALAKYFSSIPKAFRSCYFMFSSLTDQLSWQNQQLSYFTRALVEAVSAFQSTELRFKDVIDHISDAFRTNVKQTPYFITQASNTELFCSVDSKLRDFVSKRLLSYGPVSSGAATPQAGSTPQPDTSLASLVKADSERYCSEEEVLDRLQHAKTHWADNPPTGVLFDLYDLQAVPIATIGDDIPMVDRIGKWLNENANDYFALPTTRIEKYTETISVPKRVRGIAAALLSSTFFEETETKTVVNEREVVTGFRLTQQTDTIGVRLTAAPKYENIEWCDCHILVVFSKTEIRFFYLFSIFKQLNWKERERRPSGQWRMQTAPLKLIPSIRETLVRITDEFAEFAADPIRRRYLIPKPEQSPEGKSPARAALPSGGKKETESPSEEKKPKAPTKRSTRTGAPKRGTRR